MHKNSSNLSFLSGGGEMGRRIRAYDWDNSSLGNPATWPRALKTAIRLMLSSGHPMFIWWGPDLIQFYNDPFYPSIGPDRHPSALGQKARECWAEIWDTISPAIEKVISGEGNVWCENHFIPITRNGRLEDAYWTYSYDPIYDETAPNHVGGILLILAETTHIVLEKQRHREAEARWRELFTNSPSFMCLLKGKDHVHEYANHRYKDLLGGRVLDNKKLQDVLPEVYQQGLGELMDQVYSTGETHIGRAAPIALFDAQNIRRKHYLDFVLQPIRNDSGEVTGIFINGYDVTERILLQQSLEEQDRRKDEFLAMLAHELRNPLAPIRNASELLMQTAQYGSMAHSLGELIKRQVVQLTRLLDDLLEVSRISQGRMELKMGPVFLDQAIKFAIESTSVGVLEKRIRLFYDCDDLNLLVNGDFARLAQSLINIIINATKYTEYGGQIKIVAAREANDALIEISDTGIGIEHSMLEKIFELFTQVDTSIDRSQGGLGIGLSVVRTIIHMHGGTITAHSDGLGKGARFSIRLPLLPNIESTEPQPTDATLAPMKFLLTDDNEDATNSLALLLNTVGHQTTVAYRGADALRILAQENFDVVLMDIGLPDIDGYKVVEKIRDTDKDLMVVAISGYGQEEDVRKAIEAGFNGHLTKPISLNTLEAKISALLATKRELEKVN